MQPTVAQRLEAFVGGRVVSLRRVRYVLGGKVISDRGPFEIDTDRLGPVVFDAGPDGEALSISFGGWVDPFAGELSGVNRDWIETHGKWTLFDLAEEPVWQQLMGSEIDAVELDTAADSPKVRGVRFVTQARTVKVRVVADELLLRIEEAE